MAKLIKLILDDFCVVEHAELELSYRGMVLVTGENQDTDAAGNNGSGKSTVLLQGLTWVIYGELIEKKKKHDRLIRFGTKTAKAELLFVHENSKWSIKRQRAAGKPSLELRCDGKLWPGSADAIQTKINELMGADFLSFCSTTVFGQGDNQRFFSSGDAEKKSILRLLSRSDIFRRCEELAKKDFNAANSARDKAAQAVDNAHNRKSEYNVNNLKRLSAEWERGISDQSDALLDKIKKDTENIKSLGAAAAQKQTELNARIMAVSADLDAANRLLGKFEFLNGERISLLKRIGVIEREMASDESKVNGIQETLNRLKRDTCPICSSDLKTGKPLELKKGKEADLKTVSARLIESRKKIDGLKKELSETEREIRAAKEVKQTVTELDSELVRLGRDLVRVENWSEQKKSLTTVIKANLEAVKKLQASKDPYAEQIAAAEKRLLELDRAETEARAELSKREEEAQYADFWVRGFSNRGIPSLLLDSVMARLTERANHYLVYLTDGDITVEFSTQRDLKSKAEKREEITVTCTIEGVPDSIPSNGQQRKLEIATDFALNDLALSMGTNFGMIIMDEVLDGLDSEGERRVIRLLESLRSRYHSIFVVSHDPTLSSGFDQAIKVVKKNQKSSIEISALSRVD